MSEITKITLSWVIPGIIGTAVVFATASPKWTMEQSIIISLLFGTCIGTLGLVAYGLYDLAKVETERLERRKRELEMMKALIPGRGL